jgi:hypothetical protein
MCSEQLKRGAVIWVAAVALLVTGAAEGTAAGLSSKSFTKCQKILNKGAQKLVGAKLKGAIGCAERLLVCQLAEEIDGVDFASCAALAAGKCDTSFAKIIGAEIKFADLVEKKCPVELTPGDLRSRRGLGFGDIDNACAALLPVAN